jgi:hypothetical protein
MAHIPLDNETDYALTDDMRKDIIRDAQEYFGEYVRSIRVQDGIERHAFNARTGEGRYAFSPNDFGFMNSTTPFPDVRNETADIPRLDEETEAEILLAPFEGIAGDEEDMEPLETSLESLEEGRDEEEGEEDFFKLDNQVEDVDDDEAENFVDHDDDDD